ncbi:MAG: hypothetical protein CMO74_00700 [Verrucomicrobiales bacterium]|nr:hypothetical protein [Verrucomicrobiales bacterium]|tara:strand:- start:5287 stop:8577 length:3291 start_codon:yes stop_codon:yes gene_type:complete
MRYFVICCSLLLLGLDMNSAGAELPTPKPVNIRPASDEGLRAMRGFQVAKDLQVNLVAAEPLLANPVAFDIDEKGRFYVVESHRLHKGVMDIRGHMNWLDEELASQSTEDMRAMFQRYKVPGLKDYSDRVRLLFDEDGDGKADRATVFADGFNDAVDGLAAGVMARNGKVWLTNIPHLWLLEDRDNDGRAEIKQKLASGFGVRVGFLGHDLHGLRMGPDGRVYFSVGDRAASVTTREGRKLHTPEYGTIYRCEPDGSNLEIFHSGLRNPQELAFDAHGNLFTGDNNSDGGDPARWVHAVEGGDSGWRIGWQFIERSPWTNRRGPWLDERMCFPDGQAAHRIPPIANIGNGPSGLTYYPGTGLGDAYNNTFLMCDFRGGPANSGVHTIRMQPNGAHFKVESTGRLIWRVLVTDVEFGYDGHVYISDWVNGWGMPGKGRIYRISNPTVAQTNAPSVQELFQKGFDKINNNGLVNLLAHGDMRVRQAAQFELVKRGAAADLGAAAKKGRGLPALHATWGLGQLARAGRNQDAHLIPLLNYVDVEIRANAAKMLGDAKSVSARSGLIEQLSDANPRVRAQAAIALGKLPGDDHLNPLLVMIRANADKDPIERHAAVMALANLDPRHCADLSRDKSPAVRLAGLLALRRQGHPSVARFLNDSQPDIVLEAARAIADEHIEAAMPTLAKLATNAKLTKPVMRRALNANFRTSNANALAAVAANATQAALARAEALNMLAGWANPSGRDRVTGLWRPFGKRDGEAAARALAPRLGNILNGGAPVDVRLQALAAVSKLRIQSSGGLLLGLVKDAKEDGRVRVEALNALGALNDVRLGEAVVLASKDGNGRLRQAATRLAGKVKDAMPRLKAALEKGSLGEQQAALTALGDLENNAADTLLAVWLKNAAEGKVAGELHLELLEAGAKRKNAAVVANLKALRSKQPDPTKEPFNPAAFAEALEGGDATRGRTLFYESLTLQCARCHRVGGQGGEVGPALDAVGHQPRLHLLESMVNPNAKVTQGFETTMLDLKEGGNVAGIVKDDASDSISLIGADGMILKVAKTNIASRKRGVSSMPPGLHLTIPRRDLRDLVEFLSSLKANSKN